MIYLQDSIAQKLADRNIDKEHKEIRARDSFLRTCILRKLAGAEVALALARNREGLGRLNS